MSKARAITVETEARPQFLDLTEEFIDFVRTSGVADGLAVAYTQHTSCCVLLQEDSEDVTYFGMPLILQDTLNVLGKIAPPTPHEGVYLHPGPTHIRNAADLRGEHPSWGLNTDGHIISSILGRSEIVPVAERSPVLGEFGRIYFGDLDGVRARTRTVIFQILGD